MRREVERGSISDLSKDRGRVDGRIAARFDAANGHELRLLLKDANNRQAFWRAYGEECIAMTFEEMAREGLAEMVETPSGEAM